MVPQQRLHDVDVAKGLAIFLVVLGHLAIPGSKPLLVGNDVYFVLRKCIYSFHMPFFMFLSGVIFYYTYTPIQNGKEYLSYGIKKAKRLLLPFILFGSLVIIIKMASSHVFYVPNVRASSVVEVFFNLLFKPRASPAISLWYLYVLFEFYIVFPLLLRCCKNRITPLLGIGMLLFFVPAGKLFALKSFVHFFIFFSMGIAAIRNYDTYLSLIKKYRIVFIPIFGAFMIFALYQSDGPQVLTG